MGKLEIAIRVMPSDTLVHHRNGFRVIERRHFLQLSVSHPWNNTRNFHAFH